MQSNASSAVLEKKKNFKYVVGLCLIGTILNCVFKYLAVLLELPLYLDTIGTILTAALGGYLPGIAVGFATNAISSFSDISSAYYGTLNVLIAVCAAFFAKKGYFKKVHGIILSILAFTLIGGGIGSIMTWFMYGVDNATSQGLAGWVSRNWVADPFLSTFIADLLTDIWDKAAVVLISALILHFVPERLAARFTNVGWQQAPLSKSELANAMKKYARSVSLRTRILVMLGAASILIAVASTGISFFLHHHALIEDHKKLGLGVCNLAASVIDPEMVETYIAQGEAAEGYLKTEEQLYAIRESSPDIEYIYVYQMQPDGCHVVFDLDTDDLPGGEPGEVIPFDESFSQYLPALLAGEEIEPVISDDTYGWLLSIYTPIYAEDGHCACYAAVDISMNEIRFIEYGFLTKVISLFLGFFILILSVGFWIAEYNITLPINTMALTTGSFAFNSEMAREESVEHIRKLEIQTGDEIENLFHAIVKTTGDTVAYIAESQKKSKQITQMQQGLILVLADLVESRDKCTGDHVRKTAAYAEIILHEMKREGLHPDVLTDEFIADVVLSAPLHDIGKINVPDALLNKPGRLTEEEFKNMQAHTTAGRDIIESAIGNVAGTDAGYLNEAKILAAYHHERWDGSGYPCGIVGEDIPLSARVMAVADVFDALVSRRSYKAPFPFEKAVQIIQEGSGSHFDPDVAHAFLNSLDEVRRVAEEHAHLF